MTATQAAWRNAVVILAAGAMLNGSNAVATVVIAAAVYGLLRPFLAATGKPG